MGIRIVVCIDTDHDDPVEAYRQVFETMQKQDMGWESSDEWYADDGDPISETIQVAARKKVFTEMETP